MCNRVYVDTDLQPSWVFMVRNGHSVKCLGNVSSQLSRAVSENPPVRLTPLGWRAGLNPPLQKGEVVGMPIFIEMLLISKSVNSLRPRRLCGDQSRLLEDVVELPVRQVIDLRFHLHAHLYLFIRYITGDSSEYLIVSVV